jgi:hypothetical protein
MEEQRKIFSGDFLHDLDKIGSHGVAVSIDGIILADALPEKFVTHFVP